MCTRPVSDKGVPHALSARIESIGLVCAVASPNVRSLWFALAVPRLDRPTRAEQIRTD